MRTMNDVLWVEAYPDVDRNDPAEVSQAYVGEKYRVLVWSTEVDPETGEIVIDPDGDYDEPLGCAMSFAQARASARSVARALNRDGFRTVLQCEPRDGSSRAYGDVVRSVRMASIAETIALADNDESTPRSEYPIPYIENDENQEYDGNDDDNE